jgi:hypothetical protein
LTEATVLAWADDFHARTGRWPKTSSGRVPLDKNEKWLNVDQALRLGLRGLPGGDSLARLLDRKRGVRNVHDLPPLTEAEVCRWARDHYRRTGGWPNEDSGPVAAAPGEVWKNIDMALRVGLRGLPGGDTLAKLLLRRVGPGVLDARATPAPELPPLTALRILAWAREHRRRTGRWPGPRSGAVAGRPGETWKAIDLALLKGHRGLPPGGSLEEFLRSVGAGPSKRGPKPNRKRGE